MPGPQGGAGPLMRPYEVMIILDAGLEDGDIQAAITRTTDLIAAGGGRPGKVDRWGKRRLAYELDHRSEGYYVLLQAEAEPNVMAELDRVLRLADEVVRHKVIRLPENVAGTARPEAAEAAQPAS